MGTMKTKIRKKETEIRLSQQSPSEKSARLNADAERMKKNRENESDAEKEARLASMRTYKRSLSSSPKKTSPKKTSSPEIAPKILPTDSDPSSPSSSEEGTPQKLSKKSVKKKNKAVSNFVNAAKTVSRKRLRDCNPAYTSSSSDAVAGPSTSANHVAAKESEPVMAPTDLALTPSLPFAPVGEDYQMARCAALRIPFVQKIITVPCERMGTPNQCENVRGDGNCFFRAISVWVTGSQDSHAVLRQKFVLHAEKNRKIFSGAILNFDEWLGEMAKNKSYGDEDTFAVMAHFLNTTLHVYMPAHSGWQTFETNKYDPKFSPSSDNIYINFVNDDHFMVVKSVFDFAFLNRPDNMPKSVFPLGSDLSESVIFTETDHAINASDLPVNLDDMDWEDYDVPSLWNNLNANFEDVPVPRCNSEIVDDYDDRHFHNLNRPLPTVRIEPLPRHVHISNLAQFPNLFDDAMLPRPTRRIVIPHDNRRRFRLFRHALSTPGYQNLVDCCYLGSFNEVENKCDFCGAFKFSGEMFNCCGSGAVQLPAPSAYPPALQQLYIGGPPDLVEHFSKNQKKYNEHFALAAMSVNQVQSDSRPGSDRVFRMNGEIVHGTRPLHPAQGNARLNGQLYVFGDGEYALEERMRGVPNLRPDVLRLIQNVLWDVNPYARAFQHFHELEEQYTQDADDNGEPAPTVSMRLLERNKLDRRRNRPLYDEVAVVFTLDNEGRPSGYNHVVKSRADSNFQRISRLSSNLDPMCFPLLFPNGDPGWHPDLPRILSRPNRNRITQRMFYRYRLSQREGFNPLFSSKLLTQKYCVDAWVKSEANDLNFHKTSQTLYREKYNTLWDHVQNRQNRLGDPDKPHGTVTVLPPSFPNSPRNMLNHFQDALAICTRVSKCDLFVTVTFNPKWREVQENLPEGITDPVHAPVLVARVFKMKLDEIKKDIWEGGVFGKAVSYVGVIEFQKRGYPHAHILVGLAEEDKLRTAEAIDRVICADIPNEQSQPELYKLVKSHMIHGPCGEDDPGCACMVDGKCSKEFPKKQSLETIHTEDGFPTYKRPPNGRQVTRYPSTRNSDPVLLDNRYVVPYNPYLLQKFNTHINVEAVTGFAVVKYLYKYLYKGFDLADVLIEGQLSHDEIKQYIEMRHVTAPEACWRLFEFPMHDASHSVTTLNVHLEGEQSVFFGEGEDEQALQRSSNQYTHLTAFFALNDPDSNSFDAEAHDLLYVDVLQLYSFDKNKGWVRRQRKRNGLLARLPCISPRSAERFHLSLLLMHVPGAKSFSALKTVAGVEYPTFRSACAALGLVADNSMWRDVLSQAVQTRMTRQLRNMFAYMLIFCEVNDPKSLWDEFFDPHLIDDIDASLPIAEREEIALSKVLYTLQQHGKNLTDFGLTSSLPAIDDNEVSTDHHGAEAANIWSQFYDDQSDAASEILRQMQESLQNPPEAQVFFVDGPGCHGKTFLYNFLVHKVRSLGLTVHSSAWTGIASTLLIDGRTLCSSFKLPVPCLPGSTCNIPVDSDVAEKLRICPIIIIDEISNTPLAAVEAIDGLLRQLMGNDEVMGGKVVVFGGDFRQTLPIAPKGLGLSSIECCLKRWCHWDIVQRFALRKNMRADANAVEFSKYVLSLGDDTCPRRDTLPFLNGIALPSQMVCNERELIGKIFDGNIEEYPNRAILTPTNAVALAKNDEILQTLPGQTYYSYSVDDTLPVAGEFSNVSHYVCTPDVLNRMTPTGMPPHRLMLKENASAMLLSNIDSRNGLVNGTRVTINRIFETFLRVTINSGAHKGKVALIPKVYKTNSDTTLPFTLRRLQFPVRLCYAMTIDKAQGQEFDLVGILLSQPVFAHGQLYVACSRGKAFHKVLVAVQQDGQQGTYDGVTYTQNVVKREVFD